MRLTALEATIAEGIARDRLRVHEWKEEAKRIIESGPWYSDTGRLGEVYEDLRETQADVEARLAAVYETYPAWVAHRIVAQSSQFLDMLIRGEPIDNDNRHEYTFRVIKGGKDDVAQCT
jgi:hypothetical protein